MTAPNGIRVLGPGLVRARDMTSERNVDDGTWDGTPADFNILWTVCKKFACIRTRGGVEGRRGKNYVRVSEIGPLFFFPLPCLSLFKVVLDVEENGRGAHPVE